MKYPRVTIHHASRLRFGDGNDVPGLRFALFAIEREFLECGSIRHREEYRGLSIVLVGMLVPGPRRNRENVILLPFEPTAINLSKASPLCNTINRTGGMAVL